MADLMPAVTYTGTEICPKCGAADLTVNHDKERDTLRLACRKCAAQWEVLPLNP